MTQFALNRTGQIDGRLVDCMVILASTTVLDPLLDPAIKIVIGRQGVDPEAPFVGGYDPGSARTTSRTWVGLRLTILVR